MNQHDLRIHLGRTRRQLTMHVLRVMPRSALRILPGSSRWFGPPRGWATWPEYREATGAEWRGVFPARECRYPRPLAGEKALAARLWRQGWPEQGVAILKNARVLDADGWPIAKADTLLVDLATGHGRPEYTAYLSKRCRIDDRVRGRLLNLATCYARENYCHFLLEALPRLELFLRAGFTWDDVDWVIVPEFLGSAREAFFEALGLPLAKVVRAQPGTQYEAEVLFQPSFPGRESFVPPWVVEFYRERLLRPLGVRPQRRRRLYVARRQRGVANDAAVWAWLEARGFERLEPQTWAENIHAFAEAELVVGPHGAGLANVVFCPRGAQLLEFVPGDRPFPDFYSAAAAAGMEYRAMLTSALLPAGKEYERLPSDEPLEIEVGAMAAQVEAMIARAAEISAAEKRGGGASRQCP